GPALAAIVETAVWICTPIRQQSVPAAGKRAPARSVKRPPRHASAKARHDGRSSGSLVTPLAGAPAARRVRRLGARTQSGRARGESGSGAAERAVGRGAGTGAAGHFGTRRLRPKPVRNAGRS